MTNDLINEFLELELNDSVREVLAVAVKASTEAGVQFVIRGLEFNCFECCIGLRARHCYFRARLVFRRG